MQELLRDDLTSGDATDPQQLQRLLMCMGTAVGPAAFLLLLKNREEGDETPVYACLGNS